MLVYAPAILLLAWWLSRDSLPQSPVSPPSAAVLRQAAQSVPAVQSGPAGSEVTAQTARGARRSVSRRPTASVPVAVDRQQASPVRGALVDVSAPGVTPPVLVSLTARPPYPPLALARRISGTVWLDALVDEKGKVSEIALARTSAPGVGFEDAAMTYAYSFVYRPATKEGVPVRVRLPITVEFQVPER